MRVRTWLCSCHSYDHSITLSEFEPFLDAAGNILEDEDAYLSIAVGCDHAPLWKRVRTAWHILRQGMHPWAELHLRPETRREIAAALLEGMPDA